MMRRLGSVFVATVLFAGCAADAGTAPEATTDTRLDTATQAATACPNIDATLNEHVLRGRATKTVTPFFIWQITAFYAARGPGSSLSQEYLGSDGNQSVTLYAVDPSNVTFTSNPALVDSKACQAQTLCGNDRRDGDEQCDGVDTPISACVDLGSAHGYIGGTTKCAADCTYDTSSCVSPVCGNGVIEPGENCDGAELGPFKACTDLLPGVYTGGQLKCSSQCAFDTSGCIAACGNGKLDPGESCDGTLFAAPYAASQDCKNVRNPSQVWPWGGYVNYASGRLTCQLCNVFQTECKPAPGCYAVAAKIPYLVCY